MPLINADFSANTFVLDPMLLTDTQKTLMTNIIANITANKGLTESVSSASQTKLNEVIAEVNALQEGTSVDIVALQAQIDAILFLESEAGNDSFVGAFTKLFDAINSRKETDAFTLPVTASPNGQVALDLSSFGFSALSEFEVLPQPVTSASGQNIDVTFEKDTLSQGILTIRDGDRLSFADNAESYYDAATKGSINITVIVVKTATPIVADLTEVDGDDVHLGHDAADHA